MCIRDRCGTAIGSDGQLVILRISWNLVDTELVSGKIICWYNFYRIAFVIPVLDGQYLFHLFLFYDVAETYFPLDIYFIRLGICCLLYTSFERRKRLVFRVMLFVIPFPYGWQDKPGFLNSRLCICTVFINTPAFIGG